MDRMSGYIFSHFGSFCCPLFLFFFFSMLIHFLRLFSLRVHFDIAYCGPATLCNNITVAQAATSCTLTFVDRSINLTEAEGMAQEIWDGAGTGFPVFATKSRFDVDIVAQHSYSTAGKSATFASQRPQRLRSAESSVFVRLRKSPLHSIFRSVVSQRDKKGRNPAGCADE
ncbi:hypothetical protein F4801DRAFT_365719 [Xylaria longipes]|nr:hypothetical protein F4801DRAFT_365719 [Xylaria longipes]